MNVPETTCFLDNPLKTKNKYNSCGCITLLSFNENVNDSLLKPNLTPKSSERAFCIISEHHEFVHDVMKGHVYLSMLSHVTKQPNLTHSLRDLQTHSHWKLHVFVYQPVVHWLLSANISLFLFKNISVGAFLPLFDRLCKCKMVTGSE